MIDCTVPIQRLLEALPAIIAGSLGATISGVVLLLIHHHKVKDELRIRVGEEVLRLKRAAYKQMCQVVYELNDVGWGILPDANWRRIRSAQANHVIAGSKEVVQLFYNIISAYASEEKKKEDSRKTEVEITGMVKKLWNVMRRELFDLEPIPEEWIVFYNPGPKTEKALETWKRHRSVLEKRGVYTVEDLSRMDVLEVSGATGIALDELEELRSMGVREFHILREYEKAPEG